jgi:hypothetical protein
MCDPFIQNVKINFNNFYFMTIYTYKYEIKLKISIRYFTLVSYFSIEIK